MKLCLVFSVPSLYREQIYKMIDKEYDCDWYFYDMNSNIKGFDIRDLKNTHTSTYFNIGPFYWVKGLIPLLFKGYDRYFLLGATRNLSLALFMLIKKILFPKKKVYYWTHGYYGKEKKYELALWKRPLFKMADGIFCYGNHSRNLMIKDGFNPEKVFVIYNSLAYEKQLALRNIISRSEVYYEHFNNSNPVLVMIGRLTMRKNLNMLIEALSILKEQGSLYNIVLIGDGEDRKALEELAFIKGVEEQVWFYGACYDEKTNAELIYNADMCVVPGDIGLTAIHSMMFGCPCLTHNYYPTQGPEFEAIKEGITGSFYNEGNINDLANALEAWFKQKKDRDSIRNACYNEIDTSWNPVNQINIIKKHLI